MPGHEEFIRTLHSREQSGQEARGRELERIYGHETGNDPRLPKYEDFSSSAQYRDQYRKWLETQTDRLSRVDQTVGDAQAAITDWLRKAQGKIDVGIDDSMRAAVMRQDFMNTRDPAKKAIYAIDHPKLTEPTAQREYRNLVASVGEEVARRQHELPAVLADTLALVRAEISSAQAVTGIEDPGERRRCIDAFRRFDETAREAEQLLTDWAKLLDGAVEVDRNAMLSLLGRGTLENLSRLASDLWPGLVHEKAPNSAYRLPALTAMIGRQIGEQALARTKPYTYVLAMARLAEVPNRGLPDPVTQNAFAYPEWQAKPKDAFMRETERWFRLSKDLIAETGRDAKFLPALVKDVLRHEFNDALNAAGQTLETQSTSRNWAVNEDVYRAVARLAAVAPQVRALVDQRLTGTDLYSQSARLNFYGILDGALDAITKRLVAKAGRSLPG
jgi:hypothetical protein